MILYASEQMINFYLFIYAIIYLKLISNTKGKNF